MRDYGDLYWFLKNNLYDTYNISDILIHKFDERNSYELLSQYETILLKKLDNDNNDNMWKKYVISNNISYDVSFSDVVSTIIDFCDKYVRTNT